MYVIQARSLTVLYWKSINYWLLWYLSGILAYNNVIITIVNEFLIAVSNWFKFDTEFGNNLKRLHTISRWHIMNPTSRGCYCCNGHVNVEEPSIGTWASWGLEALILKKRFCTSSLKSRIQRTRGMRWIACEWRKVVFVHFCTGKTSRWRT